MLLRLVKNNKLSVVMWAILLIFVFWLVWQAVVPSGRVEYVQDFQDDNYYIRKLTPLERVGFNKGEMPKIIGDPVYFSLRTPRRFNTAKVTFKFKREDTECLKSLLVSRCIPIIEAGVLADKTLWRYDLKPLDNQIIDDLSLVWESVHEGGKILLMRDKKFDTLESFLKSPPPTEEIAVYNTNPQINFVLDDYSSSSEENVIDYPLVGGYEFFTYLQDEDLDFKFELVDLNKNQDPDPIDILLYFNNTLIDTRHLDEMLEIENAAAGEVREIDFQVPRLPEGVYKIELRATNDIITKSIITRQNKLAFSRKLELAKNDQSDISLFTDSHAIQVTTAHPSSRQTIQVGLNYLEINETYRQFSAQVEKASSSQKISEILLGKDGLILSGNGTFTFSESAWLNPQIKRVDGSLDIVVEKINYILAEYQMPKAVGEWQEASATFDLTRAYREDGAYSFIISIPGLRADDEIEEYVEVGGITVELEGKSVWEKIGEVFSKTGKISN